MTKTVELLPPVIAINTISILLYSVTLNTGDSHSQDFAGGRDGREWHVCLLKGIHGDGYLVKIYKQEKK